MKLNEIQLSRRGIRWALNLFPPLLFNRISIQSISEDFMEIKVRVRHSWMNKNFHRTIFRGTIFSAIDPLLSYHVLACFFSQKTTHGGVAKKCRNQLQTSC